MNSRQKQISNVLSKKVDSLRQNFLDKQISPFIKLQNSKHVLSLSRAECEKMGISPLEYKKIMVDLKKRNNLNILSNQADYTDRRREKTSGTLQSVGTEMVSDRFTVPYGVTAIEFTCISYVAWTPLFTCKTISLDNVRYKAEGGVKGKTTTITVPLTASGTGIEISFQTTDSNGGLASWKLIF